MPVFAALFKVLLLTPSWFPFWKIYVVVTTLLYPIALTLCLFVIQYKKFVNINNINLLTCNITCTCVHELELELIISILTLSRSSPTVHTRHDSSLDDANKSFSCRVYKTKHNVHLLWLFYQTHQDLVRISSTNVTI